MNNYCIKHIVHPHRNTDRPPSPENVNNLAWEFRFDQNSSILSWIYHQMKAFWARLLKSSTVHPCSISLSNVSFCVPILGSKNVTCLSDAPALRGFQRRTLTYSFLRGLAAPVIGKVRVLCYEFTGVTLAWEDGQWVEAHKDILAGCSPKTSTPTLMFQLNGSYTDVQKTIAKTANRSRFWLPKIRT